jgi:Rrf2 family transcriptional regulator, nitric oxide-sensitive transcriptional repressor
MFSRTVEYALRSMVYLAGEAEARTTQQIADATRVPVAYLSKVLQSLNRQGLLKSIRGLHGGASLARTPEEITIWDVVQAVEPIQRINTCPLGLDAHSTNLCALHRKIDDALGHIERVFRESTLALILADPNPSKPLCPLPGMQTLQELQLREPI